MMNKVIAVSQVLDTMSTDELVAVIAQAQAHIEERRRDVRKAQIMAELNDLFAELSEMGVSAWYNASTGDNLGGWDLQEIIGEVRNTCDGDVVIG